MTKNVYSKNIYWVAALPWAIAVAGDKDTNRNSLSPQIMEGTETLKSNDSAVCWLLYYMGGYGDMAEGGHSFSLEGLTLLSFY